MLHIHSMTSQTPRFGRDSSNLNCPQWQERVGLRTSELSWPLGLPRGPRADEMAAKPPTYAGGTIATVYPLLISPNVLRRASLNNMWVHTSGMHRHETGGFLAAPLLPGPDALPPRRRRREEERENGNPAEHRHCRARGQTVVL